ncbi:hypothetical protein DTQ70_01555 [Runella sp. SP2]|nr:hypothetical protein DTQ70_01555 [Runella sp. SP2]
MICENVKNELKKVKNELIKIESPSEGLFFIVKNELKKVNFGITPVFHKSRILVHHFHSFGHEKTTVLF